MINREKIALIWILCLSPFFVLITLMILVKSNTFDENVSREQKERDPNMIYWSDLENPPNNLATIVYSSDGKILGEYYQENRTNVRYSKISPTLIDALICTEDVRFRDHSGIDARSLFRAAFGAFTGNNSGGASTITQQLSKMLFTKKPKLGNSTSDKLKRIQQKTKEWVVSVELEKRYGKNEIITMYLNRFDWLNQAVGIKSAARVYFETSPNTLTINESAMLVGMLKNPSLYNPIRNPEETKKRRNVVLSQMMKYNKITKQEYDSLRVLPLGIKFKKVSHNEGPSPYFREQLRQQLKRWTDEYSQKKGRNYNLYTDGLKIHTTIDSKIQEHAEKAVVKHMRSLQKEFYRTWKGIKNAPYRDLTDEEIDKIIFQAIKRSDRYKKMKKEGATENEIEIAFNKKVTTTLFSWKGEIDTIISPRDSIIYNKFFIHTGVMSMDPNTGHVKAYVGGINHKFFKYDHVITGKRQVGSTFKPFLYSLAMQEGKTPCDKILNSPVVFDDDVWGLGKDWIPENATDEFDGLSLELKFGLANSINIITAYIMSQYGPNAVVDMARKMGITSDLLAVPSICLGTFDLSVYEITGAYSTFVNQGVYTEPIFITKITDKRGKVLEEFIPKKNEALSEETAGLMVKLLQGVVDGIYNPSLEGTYKTRGTGMSLRSRYGLKSQIGGKTGTTQNYSDGWFVGITPNLVTAVWTGCEDRSAHFRDKKGYGSHTALPIFGYFMRSVYDDESITTVTEDDRFKYSSVTTENLVESKMNCNEIEFNPEADYNNEDF